MMRTIKAGKYSWIQGLFVKALPDGRIAVSVGSRVFEGSPV